MEIGHLQVSFHVKAFKINATFDLEVSKIYFLFTWDKIDRTVLYLKGPIKAGMS